MKQIYDEMNASILFEIEDDIRNWNYENLRGIGFKRTHNGYAFLEISICNADQYIDQGIKRPANESYLEWNGEDFQFPNDKYEYGKNELLEHFRFIVRLLSALKGEPVNIVCTINLAGYGLVDTWGKGVVGLAFFNAFKSCFDGALYATGLEYKQKHHVMNGNKEVSLYGNY